MDTPNRYFNGWRWQQWKADYSEADIKPCLEYFSKQFAAITDKNQGAYCTVFRLHMDPCWTNDPSKKPANEADISAFNMARYRLFLQKLYIPLIKDAIAHGLYVIVVHRESVHKTLVLEISTTAISSRYGRPLLPMSIFSRIRD